jgi:hypothetical protein
VGAPVVPASTELREPGTDGSPVAAPPRLVVGGPYRYVRNPMYVAMLAAISGQALLFGRYRLLAYPAAGGQASLRSSAGTRNHLSCAALARSTPPTDRPCPLGAASPSLARLAEAPRRATVVCRYGTTNEVSWLARCQADRRP